MLTLTKSLFALMLGFIASTIFGFIIIPFLKKLKAGQNINIYVEAHRNKAGTPTMGGLIFIIPTFAITLFLLLTGKIEFSVNLIIVLFVFLSYGLIGFLDDFISLKRKSNKGLTQFQKLLLQLIVALVFYILFRQFTEGDSYLRISALGIEWNLGWFYGVFILFLLVGSSNAVNLTDGLDGLAGGLSAIAFLAFGLIAMGSWWIEGNTDMGIFCFILMGSIMGFLVYNTNPAKVFMGDTGSLTLGATMATIAILTSHELSLAVIGGVFVIETLTVIIQITSVVLLKRKVFLMTPIHHHFERLGWKENDIVKLFWIVGFVLSLFALIYGVWL
ncbi:MAG: phospho-N-acetylmuramoyl-pentapeptide-transferase [Bacilli bacterium]